MALRWLDDARIRPLGAAHDCLSAIKIGCERQAGTSYVTNHLEGDPAEQSFVQGQAGDVPLAIEAEKDGAYHFYRLDIGAGKMSNLYMRVIVKYDDSGGSGHIKTCYFTRSIDQDGRIVRWSRIGL